MKVLLAVDGSPCSDAALAEVCRRPWPAGTTVRVVTVDRPADPSLLRNAPPTAFDDLAREMHAALAASLADAVTILEKYAPGFEVSSALLEGNPKDAILAEAASWGADLIVLGSDGSGKLKRLFLGSLSEDIVAKATCSVEIVRTPPPSTE